MSACRVLAAAVLWGAVAAELLAGAGTADGRRSLRGGQAPNASATEDAEAEQAPVGVQPLPARNGTLAENSTDLGGNGSNASDAGPTVLADMVSVPTFFWNVHWQCSMAARGATAACKDMAAHKFVELAADAQIVASVELSNGMSSPVNLPSFGLSGWTQVDGPCAKGGGGDSAALAFAPGWNVLEGRGGCLRWDYDNRAFAVARVVPPQRVQGCDALCVLAIHAPHTAITRGHEDVVAVCGGLADHCAVAMGDWNAEANNIAGLWSSLISNNQPTVSFPNERTCCWPESDHYGVYDHLATNVPGAAVGGYYVHPYQILDQHPVQEHRPVSATVLLPGAGDEL